MTQKEIIFQQYSKQDWLEYIEKTLKGKSISDLSWDISKELKGLVFAHQEDIALDQKPIFRAEGNYKWKCGVELDSLEQWRNDFEMIFDFVHLNESSADLDFKGIGSPKRLISFKEWEKEQNSLNNIQEEENKNELLTYVNLSQNDLQSPEDLDSLLNLKDNASLCGLVVSFDFRNDESGVIQLSSLVNKLMLFLSSWEGKDDSLHWFFQNLHIEYRPSANLLFELAMFRAIKMLMYNLQSHFNVEIMPCKLLSRIDLDQLAEDDNNKLILGTTACLASMISESDLILISSNKDLNEQGQSLRRLAGNIPYLLEQESDIGQVSDAMAGSYVIEDLSAKIASLAWKRMQKELSA